jgi:hypothetical protein
MLDLEETVGKLTEELVLGYELDAFGTDEHGRQQRTRELDPFMIGLKSFLISDASTRHRLFGTVPVARHTRVRLILENRLLSGW